ncbi:MAG TPA: nucleoside monophosphate kinase [Actinomycetes bacterium]|jgi:adenylate kinase|nr:nucleoside monophosphate kinase [Actinomycetes bacterium]
MATLPPELKQVLLVGPPGSGKGTMGPHLSELLGVPHVSSGQLLRASVESGDPHHIGEQVNRGHMVPDRVVAQVIAEHLAGGFILDGYPRNVRQAGELDRVLAADGRHVQLVLELVIPDEVASARLSRRARMESRSDDNPDTVAARLVTYRREAVALLAHYADRVRRVSASGDLDEVFQRAERALSSLPKGARPRQAAPSADS